MNPLHPLIASCRQCQSQIRIPDDARPGHRLTCTHCNARYYAWQLMARAWRREVDHE